ncbi:preprotein translocase subunit SecA [Patescibacteria group bacterium]|nr:preprotein translocase subunit SecA [Patescibacteria group bacterium]
MFSFVKNLFNDNTRRIRSYQPLIDQINALESKYKKYSDKKLKSQTVLFKKNLKNGKKEDDILPQAFAVVRETIRRTIDERAYDVQLMAAITLHQGAIAEQRTGEGKSHAVIFSAYLNALSGKGVHIITPNDYLSQVGAGWYPQALHFLGLSTSCIIHEQSFLLDPTFVKPEEIIDDRLAHLRPISRKEAYDVDVTYGTNNEFGFDYLRDHMAGSLDAQVQRLHHYAVVDEVDFALIDEARTPLIISSPNSQPVDKYYRFAKVAQELQLTDYIIDEKSRSATLSEYGIRKVERVLGVKNLYEQSFETIHYIENAIKAQTLFHKDKDYVVKDGQVIIVDEFTGRLMDGRRWSDGLHQAVEAKEAVTVQQESQTWATITFQNYFRLYQKLSGMTGTAATEAEEFQKIYQLDVVTIPTNRPLARIDDNDLIFKTKASKYAALATRVGELHQKGQPVLIGTTSIQNNQIVSSLLHKKNIPHQLLNAKNHLSEAQIIAEAGKLGAVTVATNMAGRGVDIILGGPKDALPPKKWQQDHDKIVSLGGLVVLGTERHESRRIDNQLRGRSGRQGDPGFSQFYVALDDDLMRVFGGDRISTLMTRFNMPDNIPLTHPMVSRVLEQIQIKVEGYNFDIRKNLVEYDDVINKQRSIIYDLRDKTLKNDKFHPQRNQKAVFSYLKKQIQAIVKLNTDPQNQQLDLSRALLEFSEILPLNETNRQKLEKQLKKSDNQVSFLLKLLQDQWTQRSAYFGQEITGNICTFALVGTLDPLWVDHLTSLNNLRESVGLQSYAQKDPLIEYRKQGYQMFQDLMAKFEYNLARKLFRLQPLESPQPVGPAEASEDRGKLLTPQAVPSDPSPLKPIVSSQAHGRNDPCPCGSGKKYKKCCYPKFG